MLQVPFYLAFAKSEWPAAPCQWMRIIGITRNCARAFIEKISIIILFADKTSFSIIFHTQT